jgi:hypothetical protein
MNTKYLFLTALFLLLFSGSNLFAQDNIQIGKSANENNRYNGALYDYSDPNGVNIKVMIWGYVKYPGKYIIPAKSSVDDLLSLAGGPIPDANLDEIKLLRVNANNTQTTFPLNYSGIMSDNIGLRRPFRISDLRPGDIMVVPGAPKWYTKDYLNLVLSIISTLASVALFIYYKR